MENHLHITYSSSIDDLVSINSSFDRGILKIAYWGDNRNGSNISKEAFERSKQTMFNCPIVCRYDRGLNQLGSHDVEVIQCEDNSLKMVNLTQPIGVIPESSNIFWKWFDDASGGHEYLCAEVLIWKRQEAYEHIKNNQITDQSMEINVKQGYTKDGIFFIDDFEFTAFCLLESATPCFEGASLEIFGLDNFKLQYKQMMEDFKETFNKVSTSLEDDINTKTPTEGGNRVLKKKKAILEKFGLTAEQLDFDIQKMTVEELEMELRKRINDDEDDEDDEHLDKTVDPDEGSLDKTVDPHNEPPVVEESTPEVIESEDFTLNSDLTELLRESLREVTISDEWGEHPRYCLMDFDVDVHEIYCWDIGDEWKLVGFSYSMNGDNVIIDFESKKRKKFVIADFVEGDKEFSLLHVAKDSATIISTPELISATNKYNEAFAEINSITQELNELKEFKNRTEENQRAAQIEAVFSMFEDLIGVTAFEDLKTNHTELSADEIEEKCFAIRGRQSTVRTFSSNTEVPVRIRVDNPTSIVEPYGGLFQEFPPRN